jgi:hypothetical protein
MCYDQHLCHQRNKKGGTKGGVNWVQLTNLKPRIFIEILMFMVVKKVLSSKFHWFKFVDLFHTPNHCQLYDYV